MKLAEHPANLLLRFVLEVAALVIIGQWAWRAGENWPLAGRVAFTAGLTLLLAAAWAVFRVPGDHSSGKPPVVAVPGVVRLAFELAFFGFALWATFSDQQIGLAIGFGLGLLLHHLWSAARIRWLVRH